MVKEQCLLLSCKTRSDQNNYAFSGEQRTKRVRQWNGVDDSSGKAAIEWVAELGCEPTYTFEWERADKKV